MLIKIYIYILKANDVSVKTPRCPTAKIQPMYIGPKPVVTPRFFVLVSVVMSQIINKK